MTDDDVIALLLRHKDNNEAEDVPSEGDPHVEDSRIAEVAEGAKLSEDEIGHLAHCKECRVALAETTKFVKSPVDNVTKH